MNGSRFVQLVFAEKKFLILVKNADNVRRAASQVDRAVDIRAKIKLSWSAIRTMRLSQVGRI